MGTRSAPMDDVTHDAKLDHGRPSAAHATRFGIRRADAKALAAFVPASAGR